MRDRCSPAAWCGTCAAWPSARQNQAPRIRRRDDPCRACPWPAAPDRGCWSVLESEENAFQCARSSGVLPRSSLWFGCGRISLFGGLVPCPAGDVNAQEGGPCLCKAEILGMQDRLASRDV